MVTPAKAAADGLRSRFVYRDDGWLDTIRILDGSGEVSGDCDDAAATMLWLVEGRDMRRFWSALRTGKAAIWRCVTDDGQRHAILHHRHHGWIENGTFRWTPRPAKDLTLRHKRWTITIAWKMLLGKFV